MTERRAASEALGTRDVYLSAVLPQIPRLLGLMNRNAFSLTSGCFDRNYWHYRITDTPSARCQEAVLTLALLHQIPGTEYAEQESLRVWAGAGVRFWLSLQHANGAFSEWYPNEQSFVATAFSTYAISEAALVLGPSRLEMGPVLERGLAKAGEWLLTHQEPRVVNQFVGSILALYNLFLVTNDARFKQGAIERLRTLERWQHAEGWFEEYGGADIGYLSLTIAYLAKLYRKSLWPEALALALRSMEFLQAFLHRNLTSGGEYGSRVTEYLIPDGFEILARESPAARSISAFLRDAISQERGVSLCAFDDRYLTYVAYNFLEAFWYGTSEPDDAWDGEEARQREGHFRSFPQAGLAVINEPEVEGVVNVHRGGAFKFVFGNGVSLSDGGAIGIGDRNGLWYAGWWNDQTETQVEERKVVVRGRFGRVHDVPLTPWRNLFFRGFQILCGRSGRMNAWVKRFLRRVLITPSVLGRGFYERTIEVEGARIVIRDTIHDPSGRLRIHTLVLGSRGSFLYTPSNQFFNSTDLTEPSALVLTLPQGGGSRIDVIRSYTFDGRLQACAMGGHDLSDSEIQQGVHDHNG